MMKLEVGKYYLTIDGQKVGPMASFGNGKWFYCEGVGEIWGVDGKNRYYGSDIIAEWTDEPHYQPSDVECMNAAYAKGMDYTNAQTGTLAELNVKLGDVVECISAERAVGSLTEGGVYDIGDKGCPIDDEGDQFPWADARFRIISRASTTPNPVRTVTRTEIVPGVYGKVRIESVSDRIGILIDDYFDRADLTAAIETLTAIRDAMDG